MSQDRLPPDGITLNFLNNEDENNLKGYTPGDVDTKAAELGSIELSDPDLGTVEGFEPVDLGTVEGFPPPETKPLNIENRSQQAITETAPLDQVEPTYNLALNHEWINQKVDGGIQEINRIIDKSLNLTTRGTLTAEEKAKLRSIGLSDIRIDSPNWSPTHEAILPPEEDLKLLAQLLDEKPETFILSRKGLEPTNEKYQENLKYLRILSGADFGTVDSPTVYDLYFPYEEAEYVLDGNNHLMEITYENENWHIIRMPNGIPVALTNSEYERAKEKIEENNRRLEAQRNIAESRQQEIARKEEQTRIIDNFRLEKWKEKGIFSAMEVELVVEEEPTTSKQYRSGDETIPDSPFTEEEKTTLKKYIDSARKLKKKFFIYQTGGNEDGSSMTSILLDGVVTKGGKNALMELRLRLDKKGLEEATQAFEILTDLEYRLNLSENERNDLNKRFQFFIDIVKDLYPDAPDDIVLDISDYNEDLADASKYMFLKPEPANSEVSV